MVSTTEDRPAWPFRPQAAAQAEPAQPERHPGLSDPVLWAMAQALYKASCGDLQASSDEMAPVLEAARQALAQPSPPADTPAEAPKPQPETLRSRLQQQCSDWGAYWRAPDAHGVELTAAQATELLVTALGVEVHIAEESDTPAEAQGEREAFEAHFKIALDLSKDADGDYINDKTIGAWGGWKAATRRAKQGEREAMSDEQIDEAAHELQRVIFECGGMPTERAYDYVRGIVAKIKRETP